jgi:pyruvate/2-oxoglutarate dehydrogenase complex dihydrolipoamide acyltransferase (E2) component
MEECISEAQQNVANLDTDQIRRQGEIEATDAARREAKERGVDLTKVEGTGSDGRIIVSDVIEAAEEMEDGAGEDRAASEAVQGAQDVAGQAAGQAQDTAGQAAGQAQQAAGQATDQAGQVAGQAQDAAGGVAQQGQQAAQQAQGTVGGEGAEEPKATNAARRKAQEMGVDLSQVQGTGSGGLITLKDVTGS